MKNSLAESYARLLAGLEGDAFQAEVCARLTSVIVGFQTIPATPHGDGGLDGVSHAFTHGYCCYGPEYKAAKTNRERVDDIVGKFADDLRKLFELDTNGKKLVHKDNDELGTILPKREKLVLLELIVNWFEDHRILGRIGAAFAACKKASRCRYVDQTAQWAIFGPKQIASRYAVDEFTIARVQQSSFIERVQEAAQTVQTVPIGHAKDFDRKLAILREIRPEQILAIDVMAENFRSNWRTALALERELGDTVPTLHHALELGRQQIATRVTTLMRGSNEPWTQLDRASEIATQILNRDFGAAYGTLVPTVATGEVARLIGECPVGWEKGAPQSGA